jgi:hypothetical protein
VKRRQKDGFDFASTKVHAFNNLGAFVTGTHNKELFAG